MIMAIINNHHSSSSPVFLAAHTTTLSVLVLFILLVAAGQAQGNPLCESTDYKTLCRATLLGINNPKEAVQKAIDQVVRRTKHAMIMARMLRHDPNNDMCVEMYENVVSDLETATQNLKDGDKGSLNTNLSAAISYYVTCDDAFAEMNADSLLIRVNTVLEHMVDNTLALVTLIR